MKARQLKLLSLRSRRKKNEEKYMGPKRLNGASLKGPTHTLWESQSKKRGQGRKNM